VSERHRVVFDCNVFLQALANPIGPAGRCIELALSGKVALYISPHVLDEIREVTSQPKLIAKFRLRPDRVAALLDNLPNAAVMIPSFREVWKYDRDPDDAHYVNLALAANAKLIVLRDKDLLDLMDLAKPEGAEFQKLFPMLRILDPVLFLREVAPQR
jgi:putative PIN family toxin of toxin-antitoxin system